VDAYAYHASARAAFNGSQVADQRAALASLTVRVKLLQREPNNLAFPWVQQNKLADAEYVTKMKRHGTVKESRCAQEVHEDTPRPKGHADDCEKRQAPKSRLAKRPQCREHIG
jgi:hypothetical protein